jgi:hypothetical protein
MVLKVTLKSGSVFVATDYQAIKSFLANQAAEALARSAVATDSSILKVEEVSTEVKQ